MKHRLDGSDKELLRRTKKLREQDMSSVPKKTFSNAFTEKYISIVAEIKGAYEDPTKKMKAIKKLNFLKALAYAVAADHVREECDLRGIQAIDQFSNELIRIGDQVKISTWNTPMSSQTYELIKNAMRNGFRI